MKNRELLITMKLGNEACYDQWDAAQILEGVLRKINTGDVLWPTRIFDPNGNTVGEISVVYGSVS